MADLTTEIIYGLAGQTISTYPPEAVNAGPPSNASLLVYEGAVSNDDDYEFAPTVAIESIGNAGTATVDAASGYSQTRRNRLSVDDTTSIQVGGAYLVANASGQRELVKPVAVVANDYVDLDADLGYDYAAAATSTLKGIKLSATVDATWVAAEENILHPLSPSYRAIWTYTAGGVVRRHYTFLRLVRKQSKSGVTIHDLRAWWDDLLLEEDAASRGQGFAKAIEKARRLVRIDVITDGIRPEQLNDTEILDQLIEYKAFEIIASSGKAPGSRPPEKYMAEMVARYETLRMRAIAAVLKVDVDEGVAGASSTEPLEQFWFDR